MEKIHEDISDLKDHMMMKQRLVQERVSDKKERAEDHETRYDAAQVQGAYSA